MLLAGFLLILTSVAVQDGPVGADSTLLVAVVSRRSGLLTVVARFVTHAGSPGAMELLVLVVASVVSWRARTWRPGLCAAAALGAAQASSTLLKSAVGRARPPLSERAAHVTAGVMACPSGHDTAAAAGFGLLAALVWVSDLGPAARRLWLGVFLVGALAVGWGRVYLGVHWPTDVLVGWLLGLFWASIGSFFLRRGPWRPSRKGGATRPLSSVGSDL